MNLGFLKKQIAFGELSNLIWAKDGELNGKYDGYVTQFIKEALDVIYAKFNLKQEAVFLEPVEGKLDYEISNEHLLSDSSLEADYDHYLWLPNQTKFDSDILKITGVIDFTGYRLPLNDEYVKHSLFTPFFNVLQIPAAIIRAGHELEVQLAMAHPLFEDDDNTEVELPTAFIPAVRAYVAYLVHSNMNTDNAVNNANKYLTQYNMILQELVGQDEDISAHMRPGYMLHSNAFKFEARGWV